MFVFGITWDVTIDAEFLDKAIDHEVMNFPNKYNGVCPKGR